jgi:outer membrane biosynthesis protein TonB
MAIDPEKEAARAGAKAMLDAGKDAAKRLYEDITLTDEEKERRETERVAAKKKKRTKWLVYLVGGVIGFLCLLMLLAKIWPYVLGLAIVAGLAWWGYRKVFGGSKEKDDEKAEADEKPKTAKRIAAPAPKLRVETPPPDAEPEPEAVAETMAARKAKAAERERAAFERERALDDELAALKRKAGK